MPQRKKQPPGQREAGNTFDRLFKLMLSAPVPRLLHDIYHMEFEKLRPLKEKLQTTTEREVDYLSVIENRQGEQAIIHIEFQVRHDPDMIFRLQEYHGILSRKYKLPIHHFVFYFGDTEVEPVTTLRQDMVFNNYKQLNIKQLDYRQFVQTDSGYDILLGLLADFGQQPPEAVIREILDRLAAVNHSEHELKIWHQHLLVLARLRNLEDKTIQILNNMPITIDLKGSFGYNEGLAEGIAKGKELVKLLGEFVTITYIVENELKMLSRLLDKQLNFQLITSLSTIPEDILLAITQVYTPEKMKKLLAAIRKARHKSSLEAGQLAVVQAFVRYGVPEALAREYLTWKKSTL
jgi:phosphoglycerate-specific signal transduction histidine kinase